MPSGTVRYPATETGVYPLLPEQARFLDRGLKHPNHWNVSYFYSVPPSLDTRELNRAFRRVISRHDAFRMVVRDRHLEFLPLDERFEAESRDICDLDELERRAFLEKDVERLQPCFSLADGPLIRCIHYRHPRNPRVLLLAHHFLIDEYGWKLFETELDAELRDRPVPPATTSYRDAVRWHAEAASSPHALADAKIWRQIVSSGEPVPRACLSGGIRLRDDGQFLGRLDTTHTKELLGGRPDLGGVSVNAMLAVAVLNGLFPERDSVTATVNTIGSGRRGMLGMPDLSRCVGDFTSCYPVTLTLNTTASLRDQLHSVQRQYGRVPSAGITYGYLRYMGPPDVSEWLAPHGEITINYVGRESPSRSVLLLKSGEPVSDEVTSDGERDNIHEVDLLSDNGELELRWYTSQALYPEETISAIIGRALDALSDFPSRYESGGM